MRVVILSNPDAVSSFVADEIAHAVSKKPDCVLGLATGGTPVQAYRLLVDRVRDKKLSLSKVSSFNLDEYVGLPESHPCSYRTFMNENLFLKVDIDIRKTRVPLGDAQDLDAECDRYEKAILDAGGIDLQLLGIGSDGHIAFNEPGSSLGSRTRVKTLTEKTRQDNARFFDSIDLVPHLSLTMGIGTILQSKEILLMACGTNKSEAVAEAIEGPLTSSVPASALQLHPKTTIVVDEDAAVRLARMDYYRQSEANRLRLGKK